MVCSGSHRLKVHPCWILFVFLPLCPCGHGLSPTVYSSDNPQLMLQWMVRVKEQILICVCRLSVYLNVEASIIFNEPCTIQEGQTISTDILLRELVLLSIAFMYSVKVSSSCVLILTHVSSTYQNK